MNEVHLILFASAFVTVFALGFQSLNVNGGHYLAAVATSLFIGVGHIALYRFVPNADISQLAAYLLGGPLGITASMYIHRRTVGRASRRSPLGRAPHNPIPQPAPERRAPVIHIINQPADYPKPPPPPPPFRLRHSRDESPPFV